MNLNAALEHAQLSKAELSRQTSLGTTTIWRAATGRPIDAKSARTLCDRFPELSFEALVMGDESLRDTDAATENVAEVTPTREVRS